MSVEAIQYPPPGATSTVPRSEYERSTGVIVVVFGAKAIRPDLPPVCASFLHTATNFFAPPSQTTRSNPLWLHPQSKPPETRAPEPLTTFIRSPWWMFTPVVSVLEPTQLWSGTVIAAPK